MGWSEGVCVFCEVLWLGPKECMCSLRCCLWFQKMCVSSQVLFVDLKSLYVL